MTHNRVSQPPSKHRATILPTFFALILITALLIRGQAQLEDYRQRITVLVSQIHRVDPYCVSTSPPPALSDSASAICAATYADIAAGRSRSQERENSELRESPPAMERVLPKVLETVEVEPQLEAPVKVVETKLLVSDVPKPPPRRGRSPRRRDETPKVIKTAPVESVQKTEPSTLKPEEHTRARSPSPMWAPGSTTYADVLRGQYAAAGQHAEEKSPVEEPTKIPLKEALKESTPPPPSKRESIERETKYFVEEKVAGPTEILETTTQHQYVTPKPQQWYQQSPQEYAYGVSQLSPEIPSQTFYSQQQSQGMFDYIQPIPDLVGFIASGQQLMSSGLGTYHHAPNQYIDPNLHIYQGQYQQPFVQQPQYTEQYVPAQPAEQSPPVTVVEEIPSNEEEPQPSAKETNVWNAQYSYAQILSQGLQNKPLQPSSREEVGLLTTNRTTPRATSPAHSITPMPKEDSRSQRKESKPRKQKKDAPAKEFVPDVVPRQHKKLTKKEKRYGHIELSPDDLVLGPSYHGETFVEETTVDDKATEQVGTHKDLSSSSEVSPDTDNKRKKNKSKKSTKSKEDEIEKALKEIESSEQKKKKAVKSADERSDVESEAETTTKQKNKKSHHKHITVIKEVTTTTMEVDEANLDDSVTKKRKSKPKFVEEKKTKIVVESDTEPQQSNIKQLKEIAKLSSNPTEQHKVKAKVKKSKKKDLKESSPPQSISTEEVSTKPTESSTVLWTDLMEESLEVNKGESASKPVEEPQLKSSNEWVDLVEESRNSEATAQDFITTENVQEAVIVEATKIVEEQDTEKEKTSQPDKKSRKKKKSKTKDISEEKLPFEELAITTSENIQSQTTTTPTTTISTDYKLETTARDETTIELSEGINIEHNKENVKPKEAIEEITSKVIADMPINKVTLITHEEIRLQPVRTLKMSIIESKSDKKDESRRLPTDKVEEEAANHDTNENVQANTDVTEIAEETSQLLSLESVDSGLHSLNEVEMEQVIFGSVKERPSMRKQSESQREKDKELTAEEEIACKQLEEKLKKKKKKRQGIPLDFWINPADIESQPTPDIPENVVQALKATDDKPAELSRLESVVDQEINDIQDVLNVLEQKREFKYTTETFIKAEQEALVAEATVSEIKEATPIEEGSVNVVSESEMESQSSKKKKSKKKKGRKSDVGVTEEVQPSDKGDIVVEAATSQILQEENLKEQTAGTETIAHHSGDAEQLPIPVESEEKKEKSSKKKKNKRKSGKIEENVEEVAELEIPAEVKSFIDTERKHDTETSALVTKELIEESKEEESQNLSRKKSKKKKHAKQQVVEDKETLEIIEGSPVKEQVSIEITETDFATGTDETTDHKSSKSRKKKKSKSVSFEEEPVIINIDHETSFINPEQEEIDIQQVPEMACILDAAQETLSALSEVTDQATFADTKKQDPSDLESLPTDTTLESWVEISEVPQEEINQTISENLSCKEISLGEGSSVWLDVAAPEEPLDTNLEEKKSVNKPTAYKGLPLDESSTLWVDILDEPMTFSDEEEKQDVDTEKNEEKALQTEKVKQTIVISVDKKEFDVKEAMVVRPDEESKTEEPAIILEAVQAQSERKDYKGLPLDESSNLWIDVLDEPITLSDEESESSKAVEQSIQQTQPLTQQEITTVENLENPAYKGLPLDESSNLWIDILDDPITISDEEKEKTVQITTKGAPTSIEIEEQEALSIASKLPSKLEQQDSTANEAAPKSTSYKGLPIDESSTLWVDLLDEPLILSDDEMEENIELTAVAGLSAENLPEVLEGKRKQKEIPREEVSTQIQQSVISSDMQTEEDISVAAAVALEKEQTSSTPTEVSAESKQPITESSTSSVYKGLPIDESSTLWVDILDEPIILSDDETEEHLKTTAVAGVTAEHLPAMLEAKQREKDNSEIEKQESPEFVVVPEVQTEEKIEILTVVSIPAEIISVAESVHTSVERSEGSTKRLEEVEVAEKPTILPEEEQPEVSSQQIPAATLSFALVQEEERQKVAYKGLPIDESSTLWVDILDEPMTFSDDEVEKPKIDEAINISEEEFKKPTAESMVQREQQEKGFAKVEESEPELKELTEAEQKKDITTTTKESPSELKEVAEENLSEKQQEKGITKVDEILSEVKVRTEEELQEQQQAKAEEFTPQLKRIVEKEQELPLNKSEAQVSVQEQKKESPEIAKAIPDKAALDFLEMAPHYDYQLIKDAERLYYESIRGKFVEEAKEIGNTNKESFTVEGIPTSVAYESPSHDLTRQAEAEENLQKENEKPSEIAEIHEAGGVKASEQTRQCPDALKSEIKPYDMIRLAEAEYKWHEIRQKELLSREIEQKSKEELIVETAQVDETKLETPIVLEENEIKSEVIDQDKIKSAEAFVAIAASIQSENIIEKPSHVPEAQGKDIDTECHTSEKLPNQEQTFKELVQSDESIRFGLLSEISQYDILLLEKAEISCKENEAVKTKQLQEVSEGKEKEKEELFEEIFSAELVALDQLKIEESNKQEDKKMPELELKTEKQVIQLEKEDSVPKEIITAKEDEKEIEETNSATIVEITETEVLQQVDDEKLKEIANIGLLTEVKGYDVLKLQDAENAWYERKSKEPVHVEESETKYTAEKECVQPEETAEEELEQEEICWYDNKIHEIPATELDQEKILEKKSEHTVAQEKHVLSEFKENESKHASDAEICGLVECIQEQRDEIVILDDVLLHAKEEQEPKADEIDKERQNKSVRLGLLSEIDCYDIRKLIEAEATWYKTKAQEQKCEVKPIEVKGILQKDVTIEEDKSSAEGLEKEQPVEEEKEEEPIVETQEQSLAKEIKQTDKPEETTQELYEERIMEEKSIEKMKDGEAIEVSAKVRATTESERNLSQLIETPQYDVLDFIRAEQNWYEDKASEATAALTPLEVEESTPSDSKKSAQADVLETFSGSVEVVEEDVIALTSKTDSRDQEIITLEATIDSTVETLHTKETPSFEYKAELILSEKRRSELQSEKEVVAPVEEESTRELNAEEETSSQPIEQATKRQPEVAQTVPQGENETTPLRELELAQFETVSIETTQEVLEQPQELQREIIALVEDDTTLSQFEKIVDIADEFVPKSEISSLNPDAAVFVPTFSSNKLQEVDQAVWNEQHNYPQGQLYGSTSLESAAESGAVSNDSQLEQAPVEHKLDTDSSFLETERQAHSDVILQTETIVKPKEEAIPEHSETLEISDMQQLINVEDIQHPEKTDQSSVTYEREVLQEELIQQTAVDEPQHADEKDSPRKEKRKKKHVKKMGEQPQESDQKIEEPTVSVQAPSVPNVWQKLQAGDKTYAEVVAGNMLTREGKTDWYAETTEPEEKQKLKIPESCPVEIQITETVVEPIVEQQQEEVTPIVESKQLSPVKAKNARSRSRSKNKTEMTAPQAPAEDTKSKRKSRKPSKSPRREVEEEKQPSDATQADISAEIREWTEVSPEELQIDEAELEKLNIQVTDLDEVQVTDLDEDIEANLKTYADVVASGSHLTQPAPPPLPLKTETQLVPNAPVQIEIVEEPKIEHETPPVDEEGFMSVFTKKDKRSRSRSKSGSRKPDEFVERAPIKKEKKTKKSKDSEITVHVAVETEQIEVVKVEEKQKEIKAIESPTKSWASIVGSKREAELSLSPLPRTEEITTIKLITTEDKTEKMEKAVEDKEEVPDVTKLQIETTQIVSTKEKVPEIPDVEVEVLQHQEEKAKTNKKSKKKVKAVPEKTGIMSMLKKAFGGSKEDVQLESQTQEEAKAVTEEKKKKKHKKNKKHRAEQEQVEAESQTDQEKEEMKPEELLIEAAKDLQTSFLDAERSTADDTLEKPEESPKERRGSFIGEIISKVTGAKSSKKEKMKAEEKSEETTEKKGVETIEKRNKKKKKGKSKHVKEQPIEGAIKSEEIEEPTKPQSRRSSGVFETISNKIISIIAPKKEKSPPPAIATETAATQIEETGLSVCESVETKDIDINVHDDPLQVEELISVEEQASPEATVVKLEGEECVYPVKVKSTPAEAIEPKIDVLVAMEELVSSENLQSRSEELSVKVEECLVEQVESETKQSEVTDTEQLKQSLPNVEGAPENKVEEVNQLITDLQRPSALLEIIGELPAPTPFEESIESVERGKEESTSEECEIVVEETYPEQPVSERNVAAQHIYKEVADSETVVKENVQKKQDENPYQKPYPENLKLDGPFWLNKHLYEEAEDRWQQKLAKDKKTVTTQTTEPALDENPDKDHDSEGGSSGRGSPTQDKDGKLTNGFSDSQNQYTSADLPGGIARWEDQSTYLSIEPIVQLEKAVNSRFTVESDGADYVDTRELKEEHMEIQAQGIIEEAAEDFEKEMNLATGAFVEETVAIQQEPEAYSPLDEVKDLPDIVISKVEEEREQEIPVGIEPKSIIEETVQEQSNIDEQEIIDALDRVEDLSQVVTNKPEGQLTEQFTVGTLVQNVKGIVEDSTRQNDTEPQVIVEETVVIQQEPEIDSVVVEDLKDVVTRKSDEERMGETLVDALVETTKETAEDSSLAEATIEKPAVIHEGAEIGREVNEIEGLSCVVTSKPEEEWLEETGENLAKHSQVTVEEPAGSQEEVQEQMETGTVETVEESSKEPPIEEFQLATATVTVDDISDSKMEDIVDQLLIDVEPVTKSVGRPKLNGIDAHLNAAKELSESVVENVIGDFDDAQSSQPYAHLAHPHPLGPTQQQLPTGSAPTQCTSDTDAQQQLMKVKEWVFLDSLHEILTIF